MPPTAISTMTAPSSPSSAGCEACAEASSVEELSCQPSTRALATTVAPVASASEMAERADGGREIPSSLSQLTRPAKRSAPPSPSAETPSPGWLRSSRTGCVERSRSRAAVVSARAIGCSEADSSEAVTLSASSPAWASGEFAPPSGRITDSNDIAPFVKVPVLSRRIVSILRVRSRTSAEEMRIPICAALPEPTRSAVGVARPRAQGQATTRTATAAVIAL